MNIRTMRVKGSRWSAVFVAVVACVACGSDAEFAADEFASGESTSTNEGPAGHVAEVNDGEGVTSEQQPVAREERLAAVASVTGDEMARRIWDHVPMDSVYQVTLDNGNVVRWGELHRGVVTVSEYGPSSLALPGDLANRTPTASEVFSYLRPGESVPAELGQLTERQLEMAPVYRALGDARDTFEQFAHAPGWSPEGDADEVGPSPEGALGKEFGQVGAGLDGASCFAPTGGCGSIASSSDWQVTRKNKTSTSTISRSDQEVVMMIACAQAGQVSYRVRYYDWWWEGWVTWQDVDLPTWTDSNGVFWYTYAGEWRLALDDGAEDFDFEAKLYDFQSGDQGSHCAYGYND